MSMNVAHAAINITQNRRTWGRLQPAPGFSPAQRRSFSTTSDARAGLKPGCGLKAAPHRAHAVVVATALLAGPLMAAQAPESRCADARDLRLVNGKIVTMDKRNAIVS